jgi:hypothetical protein
MAGILLGSPSDVHDDKLTIQNTYESEIYIP